MTTEFNGIKFFYNDVLNKNLGGNISASSGNDYAENAFNGNFGVGWESENEDDDTIESYIERTLDSEVSGDTLIIGNHNLKTFSIYINDVLFTNYTSETKNNFTVIKFNSVVSSILKIKVAASQTTTANSEKYIGGILFLETIGQFSEPQELTNKLKREQGDIVLQNGRRFIFECGKAWEFEISIFSLDQNEINLVGQLIDLQDSFYIWPCGGNTEQFEYSFPPFKFENFIKVAIKGDGSPNIKDNLYWTGLRDKIKLVEVE